jgi:hypothetical protein
MCADDVVCHGARPLFFLDYLAVGRLSSRERVARWWRHRRRLRADRLPLVGGETAEHPGVMAEDASSTWPASASASSSATSCSTARAAAPATRRRPGQRRACTPTATRSCARCSRATAWIWLARLEPGSSRRARRARGRTARADTLYAPTSWPARRAAAPAWRLGGLAHVTGGGLPATCAGAGRWQASRSTRQLARAARLRAGRRLAGSTAPRCARRSTAASAWPSSSSRRRSTARSSCWPGVAWRPGPSASPAGGRDRRATGGGVSGGRGLRLGRGQQPARAAPPREARPARRLDRARACRPAVRRARLRRRRGHPDGARRTRRHADRARGTPRWPRRCTSPARLGRAGRLHAPARPQTLLAFEGGSSTSIPACCRPSRARGRWPTRWRGGARVTGVTVHFVDATLDGGPIVAQEAVPVLPTDDEASLLARLHASSTACCRTSSPSPWPVALSVASTGVSTIDERAAAAAPARGGRCCRCPTSAGLADFAPRARPARLRAGLDRRHGARPARDGLPVTDVADVTGFPRCSTGGSRRSTRASRPACWPTCAARPPRPAGGGGDRAVRAGRGQPLPVRRRRRRARADTTTTS